MGKGERNRRLRKFAAANKDTLWSANNTTKSLARRLRRVGWTYGKE